MLISREGPVKEHRSHVSLAASRAPGQYQAGTHGRFVLFINDIPTDTPPPSVRAVISVAREYRADAAAGTR